MMFGIDVERDLVNEIASFAHDPLGFVRFAFPWGEEGNELVSATGPRTWQADLLDGLGRRLRASREPIRMADQHLAPDQRFRDHQLFITVSFRVSYRGK